MPASGLATAAAGLGHVTLSIDSDGSIRRVPLQVQTGTQTWPHLVLSLAPSPPRAVQVPAGEDQAMLALEEQAIAYGRVPGHYRTVSFVDVIRGEVPTDFLRDRIVLVGATAAGLGDRYATPSSPQGQLVPGVEIQASLLQTLMEDSGPVPVAQVTRLALSLLPLLILLAGFLYLRPLSNMVLGLILMGLVLLTSTLLFLMGGLWFAPVPALAGLMVAYPLWSWRRLATASAYMQAELEVFERETAQRPQVLTRIRAAERQREHAIQLLTHDMRAPQVSILTLLDTPAGQRTADADRRIAICARQTLDLAEGYVLLARAETLAFNASVVDMVQTAIEAADLLWPQAQARGVTIRVPEPDEARLVMGDPGLLRRLLINLLENGRRYGPSGSILDCEVSRLEIDGQLKCQVRIRDRGPGLSETAVERLFLPFGQGGGETSGVGLGLAFVRTVAERHKGQVHYETGHPGAVFVLTLPGLDEADLDGVD